MATDRQQPPHQQSRAVANLVSPQLLRDYCNQSSFREMLRESISKHVDPDRLVRIAVTALSKESKLQECTMLSLAQAVTDAARVGLEPGLSVLGHAYIVPYFNPKAGLLEAQLQVSYKGKAELFRRSGFGSRLEARTIHEADEFEVHQGTDPRIHHRFEIGQDRGKIVGYYAVAFYRKGKGDPQFDLMSPSEVEHVRRTFSKAPDSPAWKNHHEAMSWAKVCHKLEKQLPMSTEQMEAHDLDEESRDIVEGKVVSAVDGPGSPSGASRGAAGRGDPQAARGDAQPAEGTSGSGETPAPATATVAPQPGVVGPPASQAPVPAGKKSRTLARAQESAPGVRAQRELEGVDARTPEGTSAAGASVAPQGEPPPAAPIGQQYAWDGKDGDPGPCEKDPRCLRPNGHPDFCSGKKTGGVA